MVDENSTLYPNLQETAQPDATSNHLKCSLLDAVCLQQSAFPSDFSEFAPPTAFL
jgi:hypothetical protein